MSKRLPSIIASVFLLFLTACSEGESPTDPKPLAQENPSGGSSSVSPFAGVEACGECHAERVAEYRRTPHYLTLRTPTSARPIAPFNEAGEELTTRNPNLRFRMHESKDGFHITAHQSGKSGERTISDKVDLIIGSGRIFEGYLSFDGDALFQIPVGYFAAGKRWANCPGYEDGTADFSRPISARCIDCHGTWGIVKDTGVNHFEPSSIMPGLACERCHGSGGQHIEWHREHPKANKGQHIIQPALLSPQRRLDLCGQCHGDPGTLLAPAFSYTPGAPLSDYVKQDQSHGDASFVHTANQVQKLKASSCFKHSMNIDCTDCHNPHRFDPAALREATLDACALCHKPEACKLRDSLHEELRPQCLSCHMPSRSAIMTTLSEKDDDYQDIVQLLDHRIAIHPLESDVTRLRFLTERGDSAAEALREKVATAYRQHYEKELEAGHLTEATSFARRLLKLGTADAASRLEQAKNLLSVRRRIDALLQTAMSSIGAARTRFLNQAAAMHTAQPQATGTHALVALAGHFLDQGKAAEALAACDRAEEIDDDDSLPLKADLLAHRGAAQLASGRAEPAIENLLAALEVSPSHQTAKRDLVYAYLQTQQPSVALPLVREQLTVTPEATFWLNLLSQIQVSGGQFDNGMDTLYQSLSFNANQPQVHLTLGALLAAQGQRQQAREHLEQCVSLSKAIGMPALTRRAQEILRGI